MRGDRLATEEDTFEIDVEYEVPVFQTHRLKRPIASNPRIVDENVNATMFGHDLVHEGLGLFGLGNVSRITESLSSGGPNFLDGLVDQFLRSRGDNDERAFGRKTVSYRAADAHVGACNDGNLVFESGHQRSPPTL